MFLHDSNSITYYDLSRALSISSLISLSLSSYTNKFNSSIRNVPFITTVLDLSILLKDKKKISKRKLTYLKETYIVIDVSFSILFELLTSPLVFMRNRYPFLHDIYICNGICHSSNGIYYSISFEKLYILSVYIVYLLI